MPAPKHPETHLEGKTVSVSPNGSDGKKQNLNWYLQPL
jgi:hypothetical protein